MNVNDAIKAVKQEFNKYKINKYYREMYKSRKGCINVIAYRNGGLEGNWLSLELCIIKDISVDKALKAMGVKSQYTIKQLRERDILKIMNKLEKGADIKELAKSNKTTVKYLESRIKKIRKRFERFPKEYLENLYATRSAEEVGEIIGYSLVRVLEMLKYYKIPVRSVWETRKMKQKLIENIEFEEMKEVKA